MHRATALEQGPCHRRPTLVWPLDGICRVYRVTRRATRSCPESDHPLPAEPTRGSTRIGRRCSPRSIAGGRRRTPPSWACRTWHGHRPVACPAAAEQLAKPTQGRLSLLVSLRTISVGGLSPENLASR